MSSFRRGHANLLCIVSNLLYVLPKQVHQPHSSARFIYSPQVSGPFAAVQNEGSYTLVTPVLGSTLTDVNNTFVLATSFQFVLCEFHKDAQGLKEGGGASSFFSSDSYILATGQSIPSFDSEHPYQNIHFNMIILRKCSLHNITLFHEDNT